MKPCTFCQIVSGEEPASVVHQDSVSLAFLDRRPLFPGHCLLIPKTHVATLPELASESIGPLFANARLLAASVTTALQAEGTFVAINNTVSQSVPHLHIHIVPRRRGDGLRGFFWPRNPYHDQQHLRQVQQDLITAIAQQKAGR